MKNFLLRIGKRKKGVDEQIVAGKSWWKNSKSEKGFKKKMSKKKCSGKLGTNVFYIGKWRKKLQQQNGGEKF